MISVSESPISYEFATGPDCMHSASKPLSARDNALGTQVKTCFLKSIYPINEYCVAILRLLHLCTVPRFYSLIQTPEQRAETAPRKAPALDFVKKRYLVWAIRPRRTSSNTRFAGGIRLNDNHVRLSAWQCFESVLSPHYIIAHCNARHAWELKRLKPVRQYGRWCGKVQWIAPKRASALCHALTNAKLDLELSRQSGSSWYRFYHRYFNRHPAKSWESECLAWLPFVIAILLRACPKVIIQTFAAKAGYRHARVAQETDLDDMKRTIAVARW